jgi:hypothetical protein
VVFQEARLAQVNQATLALACTLALAWPPAHAAGGHHAVDDASILEPGACEIEAWTRRLEGGGQRLQAGANCRAGPVELGVAGLHERQDAERQSEYGLQAKWAHEWMPGLSVGWSVTTAWQARAQQRYLGSSASALLTWQAREDLALHLNLGRDFVHGGSDQSRSGVALEWAPRPGWSLVGERYEEEQTQFVRAGVRLAVTDSLSVDMSRTHRLSGPGQSHWTLGATFLFRRP